MARKKTAIEAHTATLVGVGNLYTWKNRSSSIKGVCGRLVLYYNDSKGENMMFLQKFWNMLSKKGGEQDRFVIYLLLAEVFVLVLIFGLGHPQLASALGTIIMALIILYIEIIKPWLQKPDIKIEFDKEKYCHREKKEKDPCYYCHFMVANSGLSQADGCEAVLEKIWDDAKKQPGGAERQDFIPVNLKWSCEDKGSKEACFKTIYPGKRRYFGDIARIDPHPKEIEKTFTFELARTFISQDTFLKPGNYEIQISVYSKNAWKATEKFSIDWCGEWKEKLSEMKKCVKIKML